MLDSNILDKLNELKERLENKEIVKETKVDNIEHKQSKEDIQVNNVHSNTNRNVAVNKTNYNSMDWRDKNPQRMEIWYYDFGKGNGGSTQYGIRPCLISSNVLNNKYSTIRNVFPITSRMTKSDIPVHVKISNCGLKEESVILTEQITTIDIRCGLLSYVGTVNDIIMKQVDRARNIQLGDMVEETPFERLPKCIQEDVINRLKMIRTYELTIQTMYLNKLDVQQIRLMENRLDEALNGLKYYCNKNQLQFEEIYDNEIENNELLAL